MVQSPNQFLQTPEKGYLDLQTGLNNVITCVHKAGEATALTAGTAVKIVDSYTSIPAVESCDADTEIPFGFVVNNIKDTDFPAEARLEVALAGTVMFMVAGAAIARGANVSFQVATGKVITQATTDTITGQALDKAAGDNSVIRVTINPAPAP
jgi:hypothetical protein